MGLAIYPVFGHWVWGGRDRRARIQALGIIACVAWASGTAWLIFRGLRATIGLRISPAEGRAGINLAGELREAAPEEALDPAPVRELLGLPKGS